jgi:hypothetical protein
MEVRRGFYAGQAVLVLAFGGVSAVAAVVAEHVLLRHLAITLVTILTLTAQPFIPGHKASDVPLAVLVYVTLINLFVTKAAHPLPLTRNNVQFIYHDGCTEARYTVAYRDDDVLPNDELLNDTLHSRELEAVYAEVYLFSCRVEAA